MFKPVSIEKNLNNLKYVADKLVQIEWFIFFGTLLGYTRENNIIKNDDDIDIYVDLKFRDEIIKIFQNSELNFDLCKIPNLTPFFLQGSRELGNEKTYVDFYFFENNEQLSFIKEKHNFSGRSYLETNTMHIPKEIIYPIKPGKLRDLNIFIPNNPNECCQFLYGNDWKTPLSKSKDYFIDIINNKPMLVRKNQLRIKI